MSEARHDSGPGSAAETGGNIRPSLLSRSLTAVLTHPVTMALKRPVRDLVWTARAARVRNPPMPAGVTSVLFVCLGNICRSPFAEVLTAHRLAVADARIRCSSAGFRTTQRARSPAEACAAAADYGISLEAHRPRTLTRTMVDAHDLIVVMEAAQLDQFQSAYPDSAAKCFLLPLFERGRARGYARCNIADPFGGAIEAYEACYQRIDGSVSGFIQAVRTSPSQDTRHVG